MICVLDYGSGNVGSVFNVLNFLGYDVKILNNIEDIQNSSHLILPGVGHFDYAMSQLNSSGMRNRLDELVIKEKKSIIGICVGMQMMAKKSDEGSVDGLGWIEADVKKFDPLTIDFHTKLPHMGWNDVEPISNHALFKEMWVFSSIIAASHV